jgi:NAD(P)-dependent dehydrogenase (short-subunit alcohol dehydrogenase family)
MDELRGKVAIVTGSARGIGRRIALGFAEEGAKVAIVDRLSGDEALKAQMGAIEETAREAEAFGVEALPLRCDVTSAADVRAMVQAVIARWGRIDVLVNNAGYLTRMSLLETPEDEFRKIMATNIDGPFYCAKAVAPHLIAQGGGSIINIISSSQWHETMDERINTYRVSKAALNHLTVKLAGELQQHGVAVNGLGPGFTKTPGAIIEADRVGLDISDSPTADSDTKKIAQAAVFLAAYAADPAKFFTGQLVNEADYGVSWP